MQNVDTMKILSTKKCKMSIQCRQYFNHTVGAHCSMGKVGPSKMVRMNLKNFTQNDPPYWDSIGSDPFYLLCSILLFLWSVAAPHCSNFWPKQLHWPSILRVKTRSNSIPRIGYHVWMLHTSDKILATFYALWPKLLCYHKTSIT